MPRSRSPESDALDALRAFVRERCGESSKLLKVSLKVAGADGLGQRITLDLERWTGPPPTPVARARHSPDYRSVHWFGTDYVFTPLQAAVVRQLWEAWEQGTPDVGGDRLASEAGGETRQMRHIFRDNPAWDSMIVSLSKGSYRLSAPA